MKPIQQLTAKDIAAFLKSIDKKRWIQIAAAAAGVILFLVGVAFPAWFEGPAIKSRIQSIQNDVTTTNALILRRPELEKNKQAFLQFIREAKERIYQPDESSLLLGTLSKLAEESRVSIIASKPQNYEGKFPEPFNRQYEASQYDVTVEGSYHDLASFVSRIESSPKLLRVQSFHLRPQEETPQSHLADISLSALSVKKESK